MEESLAVTVDASCFPDRSRAALLESFRTRRMNHRFHYESEKQAQRWLALHEAYSPARTDDDCVATYERAFAEASGLLDANEIAVVSLGCGGGQKDLALMRSIRGKRLYYVPSDVSLPLVIGAHLLLTSELKVESKPLLVDLPHAANLPRLIAEHVPDTAKRVIAFFGMLPNFEPAESLAPLAAALRKDDFLIMSANLAPGADYKEGVRKVLPLYNNDLTREWLITVLQNAGLDASPADIDFSIQSVNGLLRIEAKYRFNKTKTIHLSREPFQFEKGETFRLFFSYRHTPEILRDLVGKYGIDVSRQWITQSGEEGVFLCRKV